MCTSHTTRYAATRTATTSKTAAPPRDLFTSYLDRPRAHATNGPYPRLVTRLTAKGARRATS
eukprot:scaffold119587_cov48-Phaeocystis_antarctica.AAC.1